MHIAITAIDKADSFAQLITVLIIFYSGFGGNPFYHKVDCRLPEGTE